jgi:hypothetical protein
MHRALKNIGLYMLFVLGFLSIIATGDGGEDVQLLPPPPAAPPSPSGLYDGQFTSTVTGLPVATNVAAIVSEDLNAHIFGGDLHYAGTVATDGDVLSGTLTQFLGRQAGFFGVDGTRNITLDGSIDTTGLFGDYSGADDEGRFNLNYLSLYEQSSSLDLASGVWTFSEAPSGGFVYTVTLTIDSDGDLFGSDTAGCIFSGQLNIIDETRNAYGVTASVTACGEFDGDYTGLAHSFDFGAPNNSVRLSIANANFAYWAVLQK